jgi:hypothetical protein
MTEYLVFRRTGAPVPTTITVAHVEAASEEEAAVTAAEVFPHLTMMDEPVEVAEIAELPKYLLESTHTATKA